MLSCFRGTGPSNHPGRAHGRKQNLRVLLSNSAATGHVWLCRYKHGLQLETPFLHHISYVSSAQWSCVSTGHVDPMLVEQT